MAEKIRSLRVWKQRRLAGSPSPLPSVAQVPSESFPSIEEAVAALQPEDPLRCLLPRELARNAQKFLNGFKGEVLYAVKSNPDSFVLSTLMANGIHRFDVASLDEIRLLHALAPSAILSFMHPVKSRRAIREAYFHYGVRQFVLDSMDELDKILEETSYAKDLTLIVRIAMPKGSALCALTGKFGIPPGDATDLLRQAIAHTDKVGISFHVGSQSLNPGSYAEAIEKAGEIIRNFGKPISVLDVGGGFPICHLGVNPPPLEMFFDEIDKAIQKLKLPKECEIWCEPGRALSGTGEALVARIELRKGDRLYLNDGSFGNMFEVCSMNWQNDVDLIRDGKKVSASNNLIPFEFFGPTCDSVDHLKGPFMLPSDAKEGDFVVLYGMGAYMAASQSGFNGFGQAQRIVVETD
jgi:ornithine decarboxylase